MSNRLRRCHAAERRLEVCDFSCFGTVREGSAASVLAELAVAHMFRLPIEDDPCGEFDATREGRRVEIKSTSGNKLYGVERSHFDELFVAKLSWDIRGLNVTHIYRMPNPPRSLGRSPSTRKLE